jgi:hypothetical protein
MFPKNLLGWADFKTVLNSSQTGSFRCTIPGGSNQNQRPKESITWFLPGMRTGTVIFAVIFAVIFIDKDNIV